MCVLGGVVCVCVCVCVCECPLPGRRLADRPWQATRHAFKDRHGQWQNECSSAGPGPAASMFEEALQTALRIVGFTDELVEQVVRKRPDAGASTPGPDAGASTPGQWWAPARRPWGGGSRRSRMVGGRRRSRGSRRSLSGREGGGSRTREL